MNIKAIETTRNGWRFRSRLEARWSVFFDALGIPFEYEMEGFELSSGWYLPDFWLPTFRLWFEIKPPDGECYHATAMQQSGKPIIVANGSPMQNPLRLHCYEYTPAKADDLEVDAVFAIDRNGHVVISVPGRDSEFYTGPMGVRLMSVVGARLPSSMILLKAAEQARSARFDKSDSFTPLLPRGDA